MSSTLLVKETSNHFIYLHFYIGPFHFLYPPPIEGLGFLRGRGGAFKGCFCGGNCAGTFDLLINSEGDVCRHFDLHFLGGQKFSFLRG